MIEKNHYAQFCRQVRSLSDRLRRPYWRCGSDRKIIAFPLERMPYVGFYCIQYERAAVELVRALPHCERMYYRYSVNCYLSYSVWGVAISAWNSLSSQFEEQGIKVDVIAFCQEKTNSPIIPELFSDLTFNLISTSRCSKSRKEVQIVR